MHVKIIKSFTYGEEFNQRIEEAILSAFIQSVAIQSAIMKTALIQREHSFKEQLY